MDIHTRYDVGDTVWHCHPDYDHVECTCCKGIGTIIAGDGEEYYCPKCDGHKTNAIRCFRPKGETITRIKYDSSLMGEKLTYETDACYCPLTRDLYPTEADAQAAADRLNEDAK